MLKVNLSRLDNMIRVQQQEKQETLTRINSLPLSIYERIYEKTNNKDMEELASKALKQRERFFALLEELARQEEYIAYLRKEREGANIRSGVSNKLQQKASLEERIASVRAIYQIARDKTPFSSLASVAINELKGADFYKSSFTDTCKTCDLSITVLQDKDLHELGRMLAQLQAQLRNCQDELATLNQETLVEIQQYSDYTPS